MCKHCYPCRQTCNQKALDAMKSSTIWMSTPLRQFLKLIQPVSTQTKKQAVLNMNKGFCFKWILIGHWTWSSQSMKISIDLSIDKSIKSVSWFDWYRFYKSIGRNWWHTCFVYQFLLIFTKFIDLYQKIYLFIYSSKNENWFHANSKFVDNWVAIESQSIKQLTLFKKKSLKKFSKILSFLQNQALNLLSCL